MTVKNYTEEQRQKLEKRQNNETGPIEVKAQTLKILPWVVVIEQKLEG